MILTIFQKQGIPLLLRRKKWLKNTSRQTQPLLLNQSLLRIFRPSNLPVVKDERLRNSRKVVFSTIILSPGESYCVPARLKTSWHFFVFYIVRYMLPSILTYKSATILKSEHWHFVKKYVACHSF